MKKKINELPSSPIKYNGVDYFTIGQIAKMVGKTKSAIDLHVGYYHPETKKMFLKCPEQIGRVVRPGTRLLPAEKLQEFIEIIGQKQVRSYSKNDGKDWQDGVLENS